MNLEAFLDRRRGASRWLSLGLVFSALIAAASLVVANEEGFDQRELMDTGKAAVSPTLAKPMTQVDCTGYERFEAPASNLDWPTSGVWRGEQIIYADALARSLVSMKPGQKRVLQVQKSLGGGESEALSEIRRIPDGSGDFLVEDEAGTSGDRLIRVDSLMNPIESYDVQGRSLGGGATLDVVYDWQPAYVDGALGVLAFADFQSENSASGWGSGLIFFDERNNARVIREWDIGLDFVFQHTQENGYVAVVGQLGFMMVWEPDPYLLMVDLSANKLAEEPKTLKLPADLSARATKHKDHKFGVRPAEQLILHLKQVEDTSGVASMFSLGSKLFLLSRKVDPAGVTWNVSELDTANGLEVVARAQVPVSATTRHLTVAVGDSSVAFLEKRGVENLGAEGWKAPYLPLDDIVVLPSAWIENLGDGKLSSIQGCS